MRREYFLAVKIGGNPFSSKTSFRVCGADYFGDKLRNPAPDEMFNISPEHVGNCPSNYSSTPAAVQDDHPYIRGFDRAHVVFHMGGGRTWAVSRPALEERTDA